MALSYEVRKQIHLLRRATPGQKYYGDDDFVYIGTDDKRLRRLEKASNTTYNNISTVEVALDNNSISVADIEAELQSASLLKFKKFTYDVNGNITRKQVYTDNSETALMYDVIFSYTVDTLTGINVTRVLDGFNFNKSLVYDTNNNLTSINIT